MSNTTNVSSTDLNQFQESLKFVNQALNKGCKEGVFNLDESYLIKVALSHLERAVNIVGEGFNSTPSDQKVESVDV